MRKIREVLRLRWDLGLSVREVADSCRMAKSSVSNIVYRAKTAGLSWPLPDLDDGRLEDMLFPRQPQDTKRPLPNWEDVNRELKRKGVTLQILWTEYKREHPNGLQYTQFCRRYREWEKAQDVVMRRPYKAGEKLFVDYAGMTLDAVDPRTGECFEAQIFVGTLGMSNYTYVEAFRTQNLEEWIAAHNHAAAYFGGVAEMIVPDNLKTGVKDPCYFDPDLSRAYLEWAHHYGCAILPTRVRKPRDKAKVEKAVRDVETGLLAPLRNERFVGLKTLNNVLWRQLEDFNGKRFQKSEASRRSLFETMEKPALRPLPSDPFVFGTWKKARVGRDYHIQLEYGFYSVPYALVGQEVWARLEACTVQIFFNNRRVAVHPRQFTKGAYATLDEHRPANHRAVLGWSPEYFLNRAAAVGPQTAAFCRGLLVSKDVPEQAYRKCMGILALAGKFPVERLEKACERAGQLEHFSYRAVKKLLDKGLEAAPLRNEEDDLPVMVHENIRGAHHYAGCDR